MDETIKVDLCVIGAGTAGLVVAAGASQMGAKVVLIERDRMGGDCLNFGCVPSKSLIAAGHVAEGFRRASPFGIRAAEPDIDFGAVMDHVHGVITAIAPHDSVERFEGLGVRVVRAEARFAGPDAVTAGDLTIRARRFVVATGSRAAAPPIPGLDRTPYLTNETVFENRVRPDRLLVIGGGPIGCEMAQAHRRLGAEVTVLEHHNILPKNDPELVDVVRQRLRREGVTLMEGIEIRSVAPTPSGARIEILRNGAVETVEGSHLLVAAGRRARVEGLDLEKAGIRYSAKGIEVDGGLRTSNRKVYAAGDVAGGLQFTHMAAHHAGIVLRNALFRLPAKVETGAVPWVTYTDPELAHVGQSEAQARKAGETVRILRFALAENDRAVSERELDGQIKVVANARGRVLGASIVGARAGELILPWVLAIRQKIALKAMAGVIAPYPTRSEISKGAAGSFYTPALFSERTRKIVRFLGWFG